MSVSLRLKPSLCMSCLNSSGLSYSTAVITRASASWWSIRSLVRTALVRCTECCRTGCDIFRMFDKRSSSGSAYTPPWLVETARSPHASPEVESAKVRPGETQTETKNRRVRAGIRSYHPSSLGTAVPLIQPPTHTVRLNATVAHQRDELILDVQFLHDQSE